MKRRFLDEFEKLQSGRVAAITGVSVSPDEPPLVTIHTNEIVIKHPVNNKLYLLGRFNVEFGLGDGSIRIVNIDRPYRDGRQVFHHPHIFEEDGKEVCLGNVASELVAYISHFEVEAAAVLAIAFLQTVRGDAGYYNRLEYFPLADAKS